MRKYGRLTIITFMMILAMVLSGCKASEYQKSIYTDNAKIGRDIDSYSYKNSSSNSKDLEINKKFGSFTGMETVWIIDAKEETTVDIEFSSKLTSGLFKTVLVAPHSEVTNVFEQQKSGKATLQVQRGKNRIKIIGKEAVGEVSLSIKEGSGMNIFRPEK